jgi:CRISPR-associated exonuclease Cas4
MPPLVRISEIGQYLRCPRLIYYDNLGNLPRKNNPEHMLLHSLMLSLSDDEDPVGQLRAALFRLEQELPLVYEIEPQELGLACRDLEGRIDEIARSLQPSLGLLLPCEVEVDLRSERLGLSGRLDRVAPARTPSLIRTGYAPEEGVWKRDRLMLAGYALLIGEKYQTRINRGIVEYPRSGAVRLVQIHSVDRGRVLRIRDRIRAIKDGQLPDRPEGARCEDCDIRERCEISVTLASKFF